MREDNDLYQRDIAKQINTTQQQYSKIENGETEITADKLIKLAKFYNVSTDYIAGLSDRKSPQYGGHSDKIVSFRISGYDVEIQRLNDTKE